MRKRTIKLEISKIINTSKANLSAESDQIDTDVDEKLKLVKKLLEEFINDYVKFLNIIGVDFDMRQLGSSLSNLSHKNRKNAITKEESNIFMSLFRTSQSIKRIRRAP